MKHKQIDVFLFKVTFNKTQGLFSAGKRIEEYFKVDRMRDLLEVLVWDMTAKPIIEAMAIFQRKDIM